VEGRGGFSRRNIFVRRKVSMEIFQKECYTRWGGKGISWHDLDKGQKLNK
jgi:hypothetical protein